MYSVPLYMDGSPAFLKRQCEPHSCDICISKTLICIILRGVMLLGGRRRGEEGGDLDNGRG